MSRGKFTLVATPIGNLGDMSPRAIEVLKESQLILCEDTRVSGRLLHHFGIQTKLLSYHEHNERERIDKILGYLDQGMDLALISDAGMPSISDPGVLIVDQLIKEGYSLSAVPGPSAFVMAVALSGFDSRRFEFLGFLPRKKGDRIEVLRSTLGYPGLSIIYESPHRLVKTLDEIAEMAPAREVFVARELTKLYEELYRGPVEKVRDYFDKGPRGEVVLVLNEYAQKEEVDLEAELRALIDGGTSPSRAVKELSKKHGIPRNEIYDLSIKIKAE